MIFQSMDVFITWFWAFTEWFNAVDCSSYGGIPCEETITDISGCTDESALTLIRR